MTTLVVPKFGETPQPTPEIKGKQWGVSTLVIFVTPAGNPLQKVH